MSCSCSSQPCSCNGLEIPQGPRGLPGVPGPAPTLTFTGSALAPGSGVVVTQTGGAGVYNVNLGVAVGATGADGPTGTDGLNAFTTLTSGTFTQPLAGAATASGVITVVDNSWMEVGQWIYIPGAGYYMVTQLNGTTGVRILNPGPLDGYTGGVVGNAPPGTTGLGGVGIGVTPGGRPAGEGPEGPIGQDGEDGTDGVDAELLVVNVAPVAPPAPGRSSVIYTDSATTPTFTQVRVWNGASWVTSANIQGAAGTLIVNTPGDPNVTLPAGPIGTVAIRTDVVSIYTKTGVSTWTLTSSLTPTFTQVATASGGNFGTVPVSTDRVIGFAPFADTHTSPGTYSFDLQYEAALIDADKDITLQWDATNYAEGAVWTWQVTNVDGSPINLALTAARFNKKTGLTVPATIAAGATQVFLLTKSADGLILIMDTFVSVAA